MQKPSHESRPIAITILAVVMFAASGLLIFDRVVNFYTYRTSASITAINDSNVINLQVVSGIAFLLIGLVPIVLAIGLWQLKSWARFLSLCLFSAIMLPALAASLGLISPPSPDNLLNVPTFFDDFIAADSSKHISKLAKINPYLAGSSAIAIAILIHPSIVRTFQRHRPKLRS
ncbi:MAG: hypothetical protein NW214_12045 [Pseudanabaenaceae cyanobacterium bins.39]|nr:hypothetical protein [Pseudanabaenaceae cyanobacterium bins.39]